MTIAPRQTRLVRVPDLSAYQRAIAKLAREGTPIDIRRRAVIVPSAAAARQLRATLETHAEGAAFVLPHLITRDEWLALMHEGLAGAPAIVDPVERDVMMYAAARDADAAGARPPFAIRPGIVAAMVRFYDELRRRDCDLLKFERKIGEELARDVEDRGAERVTRQTQFLAEAFKRYEQRLIESGLVDEHTLAARIRGAGQSVISHVVVTVGDQTTESGGLWPSDFRLLAEAGGITRVDVIATDRVLAAGLFDELQKQLPGFEDVREGDAAGLPVLMTPPAGSADREAPVVWKHRDREEELYAAVRGVRRLAARDGVLRDRIGIVFQRPLPYLYLARRAFEGARVPYLTSDALPLAAEPYAAAVDLVLEFIWSGGARAAAAAMLRSPAFRFEDKEGRLGPADVTDFEQHVLTERLPGGPDAYRTIASAAPPADARRGRRQRRAARAAAIAAACWDELAVLADENAPARARLDALVAFLRAHEAAPPSLPDARDRHLRARSAILASIQSLARAVERHDLAFTTDELAASVRRWIEEQTFAPRRGDGGVELVDAAAARYGRFDHLRVLGMVEGDWPARPPRNVFYGRFLLAKLDWPDEQKRLALAYAAFKDLVCLPSRTIALSAFVLEDEAIVGLSPYIDAATETKLARQIDRADTTAMHFPWEALVARPPVAEAVEGEPREWLMRRIERGILSGDRYRGQTAAYAPDSYSVSAIETYLRCPFRYFARYVLNLPEERDDEPGMTPQERGSFLHDVVQRFYESWDRDPGGAITVSNVDAALARFRTVAEEALLTLPAGDRAQERTLLLGSAASPGLAERLLFFEIELPGRAARRILEEEARDEFEFQGAQGSKRIPLRAKADRIDVLEGNGLRVIDYKLNTLPDADVALQLPVYGLCQSRSLAEVDGVPRTLTAAAYFSFNHRYDARVYQGEKIDELLKDGQERLLAAIDGIERGDFAPRPRELRDCKWCPYPSICRKEYAGDE